MKMATFVHFDVPAENIERAKRFYQEVFDWKITKTLGPVEYFEIATTDEDGTLGLPGGMGQRGDEDQKITNYIGVDDIDRFIEKVQSHGGTITMPKTTIPGFGYLAVFLDTERNVLGLWETDENATA
jgi:predicted enzyme related to lactoylglutathione lyase